MLLTGLLGILVQHLLKPAESRSHLLKRIVMFEKNIQLLLRAKPEVSAATSPRARRRNPVLRRHTRHRTQDGGPVTCRPLAFPIRVVCRRSSWTSSAPKRLSRPRIGVRARRGAGTKWEHSAAHPLIMLPRHVVNHGVQTLFGSKQQQHVCEVAGAQKSQDRHTRDPKERMEVKGGGA
jgi:hypothetical protein